MKLLLTGATGYLGNKLLQQFKDKFSVLAVARNGINFEPHVRIDLLKDEFNFRDQKFELVIHCAGLAHISSPTVEQAKMIRSVNIDGTRRLLEALSTAPPISFVFISSVAVYGRDHGINITEDYSLDAKDAYGQSKMIAENEILKWGKVYGVTITILRLPLIVGPNPPGNLGLMINALAKRRFFIIGKGNALRSMIMIDDVGRFISKFWQSGGIYNLTDNQGASYKQLAEALCRKQVFGKIKYIPSWIAFLMALSGELSKIFYFRPPFDIAMYNKLTRSLTFSSLHLKGCRWEPRIVLKSIG